ncbi:MAG TPA: hypothetical protein VGI24_01395 [Solirubrobacteraceae bacterium]
MPAQKVSISLDESVLLAAREAAKRRGMSLSAWLNSIAAEAQSQETSIEKGLQGVAEWEAEHGPISPEEIAKANAILDAAGIGLKRESRHAA